MNVSWPVENLKEEELIVIPLIIAVFFGASIAYNFYQTRNVVPLSLEFSGGSFIRIQNIKETEMDEIKTAFESEFGSPAEIHGTENGMEIETKADLLGLQENQSAEERIKTILTNLGINREVKIVTETMGSIISQLYKKQARNAAIAALIVMAVILFISLRHFTAIGGILSVIGLDFLGILGGMALLNIPLSLASMAGILLIFGYAVNTNILLSTNILRRKGGSPRDRAAKAMSTGIKMSSTSAIAMIALNLISTSSALNQISAILVIGILVDMVNTWLMNSGILLKYETGRKKKYHARI